MNKPMVRVVAAYCETCGLEFRTIGPPRMPLPAVVPLWEAREMSSRQEHWMGRCSESERVSGHVILVATEPVEEA